VRIIINQVWLFLVGVGIAVAAAKGQSHLISESIFADCQKAIQFTIGLAGVIAFWSGMLKVAEASGITETLAKWFEPILAKLFPGIPKGNSLLGLIALTLSSNMLGLGNVTTPLGIKTMQELQKLNPEPTKASNHICTFLALVLGGFSILPSTLIALRAQAGSKNATLVLGPIILISLGGTIMALLINYLFLKFNRQGKRRS